ncbi:hypothetical protein Tco_0186393 [Tanacetum coccineum]
MRNSRYDKTIDGPEVKAKDEIIASCPYPPLGDETLTNQSNKSNKYASIVASEQRAELFDRFGTLERDNLRLGGMLCVERNRVDHLRRNSIPPWKSKRSSRTEQAKPLRVRALVMTINSNLPPQIHKTQVESLKTENVKDENLHGMDKELRLVLIELPALGAGVGYHALEI